MNIFSYCLDTFADEFSKVQKSNSPMAKLISSFVERGGSRKFLKLTSNLVHFLSSTNKSVFKYLHVVSKTKNSTNCMHRWFVTV